MWSRYLHWGIRLRVLLIALGPSIFITLSLIGYFVHTQIADFDQALNEHAVAIGEYLAPASEYGVLSGNTTSLEPLMAFADQDRDIRNIIIFDSSGKILRQSTTPRLTRDISVKAEQGTDIVYRRPIYLTRISISDDPEAITAGSDKGSKKELDKEIIGWVEVRLSRHSTNQKQLEVLYNGLALSAVVLVISTFLALRIGQNVTEPILSMTQAVRSIAMGNLNTRLNIDAGPELNSMATGINAMCTEIRKSQESLQDRIDEATTQLQKTIAQLDEALHKAERASNTKSIFLANMSHEIRTPLNAIKGFTELMIKCGKYDSHDSYLHLINNASIDLCYIIDDILDISRIESGNYRLQSAPTNLRLCIERTISLLALAAFNKRIELAYIIYDDVPDTIIIDEIRLMQLLTNLINNAIKFTNLGSVELRVMLEDEGEISSLIHFEIKDTGIGISTENQQTLFTAFTQADSSISREYGGSGLGLSICKKITELMNGTIELSSELGKGTTINLRLPIKIQTTVQGSLASPMDYHNISVLVYARHNLTRYQLMQTIRRRGGKATVIKDMRDLFSPDADTVTIYDDYDAVIICLNASESEQLDHPQLCRQYNGHIPVLLLSSNYDALPVVTDEHSAFCRIELRHMGEDAIYRALDGLLRLDRQMEEQEQADVSRPDYSQFKVMVVDDNHVNLKLISVLLNNLGIETIQATNGHRAIELFSTTTPDLVFMDVHMPGISGLDTAKILHQADSGHHCPIVALTADVMLNERNLIRSGIIDGVMLKPISEAALIQQLDRFLLTGVQTMVSRQATGTRPDHGNNGPALYDRKTALQRCQGDAGLADELWLMALHDLPRQRKDLLQRLHARDMDAISALAHRIKGSASYCCLPALEVSSAALEAAAQGDFHEGIERPLLLLVKDIDDLLNNELGRLSQADPEATSKNDSSDNIV